LSLGDIPGLGPASYLVLITWWLVGACTSTVPVGLSPGTLCGCFAHSPPRTASYAYRLVPVVPGCLYVSEQPTPRESKSHL